MNPKPVFALLVIAAAACGGAEPGLEPADVIYRSGRIYTVDPERPWAEAVAAAGGRIVAVGSNEDVERFAGPETETIDLQGRFVMPGVFDLHSHPFITPWYGTMNLTLDSPGDAEAILEAVRAYAEANPDREWIIGGQWLVGMFPDDNPRREDLDAAVADRPPRQCDPSRWMSWQNHLERAPLLRQQGM